MRLMEIILLALCLGLCGCVTFKGAAGKTLATAAVTVDGAMQGWAAWVAQGQASAADEARVKAAYAKFGAAMQVAKVGYVTLDATGERAAWEQAQAVLVQNQAALLQLVRELMR